MSTEPDLSSPGSTSESEEMYLITVARAAEDGEMGPIPIARVAKELRISVASANEMVRKLTARELLDYEPYRGVRLTDLGSRVAERVLRTRRLWATFLADHLGLTPVEADDQACLLEHVTLPDAVDRLASFLGDPHTGPLGNPIPDGGVGSSDPGTKLSDLSPGVRSRVTAIRASKQGRSFLEAEGICPGAVLTIESVGSAGMLVRVGSGSVYLDQALISTVLVEGAS